MYVPPYAYARRAVPVVPTARSRKGYRDGSGRPFGQEGRKLAAVVALILFSPGGAGDWVGDRLCRVYPVDAGSRRLPTQ